MNKTSDDLSLLDPEKHWLGWLGDDPQSAVRDGLEGIFQEQVQGTKLEQLVLVDPPSYLTGGKPSSDPSKLVVTRAGLVVTFEAIVVEPNGTRHHLTGAFSWVAVNLDTSHNRIDRRWLDLYQDAEHAPELLKARMYFDDLGII